MNDLETHFNQVLAAYWEARVAYDEAKAAYEKARIALEETGMLNSRPAYKGDKMRTPNPNHHIETLKLDLVKLRKALRLGRISQDFYRELRWDILEDLHYWRSFARQE